MSERLQNVLRILQGGAADRRRTQLGLGVAFDPEPSRPPERDADPNAVRVQRMVAVGAAAREQPREAPARQSGPVAAPAEEPDHAPAEEPMTAMTLYAPAGEALAVVSPAVVETRGIPRPRVLDPRLVMLRDPGSARARSFRLLAHRLRHAGDPRVVVVTSASQKEGKTTTAVNLALALAEDGAARVLLIEANARSPIFAELFELDNVVGLPRQMARLTTALTPWTAFDLEGTRLSILPAEPSDPVVPSRGVFDAAIADLRTAFDYVIVDAPSVLDSADVVALLDAADGVLLAARAKRTRARDLEKAAKQLAPANVVGVVLLDVKEAAKP
jgi:Mrp family chromosome partitioning ATPase